MLSVHRWLGTWDKAVDVYIALTEFARAKFIQAGIPAEKIVVKPNFVDRDPLSLPQPLHSNGNQDDSDGYALFVGRLSQEKGVATLLSAWQRLGGRIPLRIIGDGPLREQLKESARQHGLSQVIFEGRRNSDETLAAMRASRFLVFPSEWYETFGRVAAESFSCGVPVIASRLGAMEEIVTDGITGLHFTPGDAGDLARKVDWALSHRGEMTAMGRRARAEYEAKYTPERNYGMLMNIYERTLEPRASIPSAKPLQEPQHEKELEEISK
jgi:glycosyltransferase involved in cell wall biosynthesis